MSGAAGTTVSGSVVDNGDGTYTIPVVFDPSAGSAPGVVVDQPGRPPVVLGPIVTGGRHLCRTWKLLICLLLLVIAVLILILLFG